MLSKARIKLIQSLNQKKQRSELKVFVVEGKKQVTELLTSSYRIQTIVGTESWMQMHAQDIKNNTELITVDDEGLRKASLLQAPQEVLAIVHMPDTAAPAAPDPDAFTLVLDGIQDPGNLGTIIRIADWYGLKQVVCSNDCVDVYNPKTIQATMGSFMRVHTTYTDLIHFLAHSTVPVLGAVINGVSVYQNTLPAKGVLVIGNEGKGISPGIMPLITHPISIPRIGGAESLNAAIATAIICDNLARTQANATPPHHTI